MKLNLFIKIFIICISFFLTNLYAENKYLKEGINYFKIKDFEKAKFNISYLQEKNHIGNQEFVQSNVNFRVGSSNEINFSTKIFEFFLMRIDAFSSIDRNNAFSAKMLKIVQA
jgi:hypothetical protein